MPNPTYNLRRKNSTIIVLLAIMISLFSKVVSAQSINPATSRSFDHISVNEGLSHSYITSIVQDHKGFMWFGTWEGLNRYDGYEFKTFRHNPKDSTSITSEFIQSLTLLKDSSLWVGTNNGMVGKLDRKTNSFENHIIKASVDQPVYISSIHEHSSGLLYIGTSVGLFKFDRTTSSVVEINYSEVKDPTAKNVKSITEDSYGNLFLGTQYISGGLFYVDLENNKSYQFTTSIKYKDVATSFNINAIRQNQQNQLFFSTNNGIYELALELLYEKKQGGQLKYNLSFKEFTSTMISGKQVQTFEVDNNSNFWIGTFDFSGVQYYRYKSDSILWIDIQGSALEKFKSVAVMTVFVDRSGILWLGTNGAGIYKYAPSNQKFSHLKQNNNDLFTINSKSIRTVYEDSKNRLWIGGYGGLDVIELSSGKSRFVGAYSTGKPNISGSQPVWFVFEDPFEGDDIFWIATEGHGLFKYNYRLNNLDEHYYPDFGSENPSNTARYNINSRHIITMFRGRNNDLLIGTNNGLERFDTVDRAFIKIPIPENYCGFAQNGIYKIIEPRNNSDFLWIASSHCGLFVFDKNKNVFHKIVPDESDSLSILDLSINTLLEDHQQQLWIGTNKGISRLDLKSFDYTKLTDLTTTKFKNYTSEHGLANNYIYGLLEDNRGKIWISSNHGLTKLDPTTDKIENFDTSDGLQDLEFNRNAYSISKDGVLYFGGKNGINYFHPDDIEYNNVVPEVSFTEFKVLNQQYPITDSNDEVSDINEIESITLTYDQNIISFSFAGLEFSSPKKNQYAYMLEGFNEDWVNIGNNREAIYTNLDPGSYMFRVKASNNDGIWNEQGKSVQVIINPPWWYTNWAYTIYIFTLAVIIFFVNRILTQRIKMQEQLKYDHLEVIRLKELDEFKSNFFANISHEFRTPLTLIINPLKNAANKINEPEIKAELGLVDKYANKLLQMVNQILDLSKLEAGKMTKSLKVGDLARFINIAASSFDSLAANRGIEYQKIFATESIIANFNANHIEKILNNVLSNAFKFTQNGGKITLLLEEFSSSANKIKNSNGDNKSTCKIIVRDTGDGISPEAMPHIFDRFYQEESSIKRRYEGTGIGLSLVKELIEFYDGSVTVKSEIGWGTEIKLILPLDKIYSEKEEQIVLDYIPELSQDLIVEYEDDRDEGIVLDTNNEYRGDKNIVLVVEDNKDLRAHICKALKEKYVVIEAGNGSQGLKAAEENIPDLIISDVMMPEMDGLELTQKLKTDQKTSHVPIILLTAKSDIEDKLTGLKLGADEYLSKPFNEDELLIRIENLIQIRTNLQSQFRSGDAFVAIANLPTLDDIFFKKAKSVVEENIDNEQFSVEDLASELAMSRVQFHRKIKALTNQSTTYFIRTIRLERAKKLLQLGNYNVTEVAYMVGFSSQSYFTKSFQKHFSQAPSDYQK
jgi:signal transduction histidine kinase/ligand-binding sensor domain-containing protein/DNA-binding response OmpR family regulator